jgi:hypothetical protein
MMDSPDMTNRVSDFLSGDSNDVLAYEDIGVLPWWTYDSLRVAFWRALSSLPHVIDYAALYTGLLPLDPVCILHPSMRRSR